jgi:hypothetical protein
VTGRPHQIRRISYDRIHVWPDVHKKNPALFRRGLKVLDDLPQRRRRLGRTSLAARFHGLTRSASQHDKTEPQHTQERKETALGRALARDGEAAWRGVSVQHGWRRGGGTHVGEDAWGCSDTRRAREGTSAAKNILWLGPRPMSGRARRVGHGGARVSVLDCGREN